MSDDTIVNDHKGDRIIVGSKVIGDPDYPAGTVVIITDPDGDTDDYGRMFGIEPMVYIRWDDDTPATHPATKYEPEWDDRFGTSYDYAEGSYECDDVELVSAEQNEDNQA